MNGVSGTEVTRRSLDAAVRDLELTGLTKVGGGLEFQVWRASHPRWGAVALRVPRRRFESNANDPYVDTGELLSHEAMLYQFLRRSGVQVPRHYGILHHEVDISVSEFVSSDDTVYRSFELGQVAARLHETVVPAEISALRPAADFAASLSERLIRRWSVLRELSPELPALAPERDLEALVPPAETSSLLHLDLRAANLLVREGRIHALIDWSNWLMGDPALELARVAAYAYLDENRIDYPEFLRGYESVRPAPERTLACWNFYHLDAVTMLAIVFNCEAPHPHRGPEMLRRLARLCHTPWNPATVGPR